MLYTKIQSQSLLGYREEEKIFQHALHIWANTLFNGAQPFELNVKHLRQKARG